MLIDKTEIIWDNLNPDFSKSFVLDYIFEVTQTFKIEVVDIDDERTGIIFTFLFYDFLVFFIGTNEKFWDF